MSKRKSSGASASPGPYQGLINELRNEASSRMRQMQSDLERTCALLEHLGEPPAGPSGVSLFVVANGFGSLRLLIDDLAGLKAARQALRAVLPDYRDALVSVYVTGERYARAIFEVRSGTELQPVQIALTHTIKDWPLKHRAGCGFKPVHREYDSVEFCCAGGLA